MRRHFLTFLAIVIPVLAWHVAVALTSSPDIQERIITAPHPVLNTEAVPISPDDTETVQLLIDMVEYVDESFPPKSGLALPQLGISKRGFVATIEGKAVVMMNPRVIFHGTDQTSYEGCLSLPGIFRYVYRNDHLSVEFHDEDWEKQTLQLRELTAFIVQHELDHLDGILITDKPIAQKVSEVDKNTLPLE